MNFCICWQVSIYQPPKSEQNKHSYQQTGERRQLLSIYESHISLRAKKGQIKSYKT